MVSSFTIETQKLYKFMFHDFVYRPYEYSQYLGGHPLLVPSCYEDNAFKDYYYNDFCFCCNCSHGRIKIILPHYYHQQQWIYRLKKNKNSLTYVFMMKLMPKNDLTDSEIKNCWRNISDLHTDLDLIGTSPMPAPQSDPCVPSQCHPSCVCECIVLVGQI